MNFKLYARRRGDEEWEFISSHGEFWDGVKNIKAESSRRAFNSRKSMYTRFRLTHAALKCSDTELRSIRLMKNNS